MGKRKVNTNTKKHYVNNGELKEEVVECKKKDVVSDRLARMFISIVDGVSLRFNNLHYYGIPEDVKQDCLLLLLQKYKNYDPERVNEAGLTTSCFAFMTTITYNQMRYQLNKAKKFKDRNDEFKRKANEFIQDRERK